MQSIVSHPSASFCPLRQPIIALPSLRRCPPSLTRSPSISSLHPSPAAHHSPLSIVALPPSPSSNHSPSSPSLHRCPSHLLSAALPEDAADEQRAAAKQAIQDVLRRHAGEALIKALERSKATISIREAWADLCTLAESEVSTLHPHTESHLSHTHHHPTPTTLPTRRISTPAHQYHLPRTLTLYTRTSLPTYPILLLAVPRSLRSLWPAACLLSR